MSRCEMETCANWTGDGCICQVLMIDEDDRPIVGPDGVPF